MEVTNFYNYGTMNEVEAGATQINNYYGQSQPTDGEAANECPSQDQMKQAVMATMKQGFWWSNRSWAVVYRVYQLRGYRGSISQFIREVETWQLESTFTCNYDAVQKPLASGQLIGDPVKWELQGTQAQFVKLADALQEELEKGMNDGPSEDADGGKF